jgi:hypothetical protein
MKTGEDLMKNLSLAWLVLLVPLLVGCEFIFTSSVLSFAQRDPSKMTLEQQINFARDALASGDTGAMTDAYDALKGEAATTSDGDLQLLTGQLAMELCGLSDFLDDILVGDIDFSDTPLNNQTAVETAVAGLDAAYRAEAAVLYTAAESNGADMDATDYLIGAIVLLSQEVATEGSLLAAGDAAETFLGGYLATADPADPSYELIDELNTFLLAI